MKIAVPITLRRLVVVAVIALVLAACGRTPLDGPPDAKLTYYQASALAAKAAKASGIPTDNYNVPVVSFDKGTGEWRATFTLLQPGRLGANFQVAIDDSTQKTRIVPGV
jgi:predicted small lipoprotein YifL